MDAGISAAVPLIYDPTRCQIVLLVSKRANIKLTAITFALIAAAIYIGFYFIVASR